jgi:predicted transcriptional regulator
MMSQPNRHLLALSAQIVAAHAGNNQLEARALPSMIRSVFKTLSGLDLTSSEPASVAKSDAHDDEHLSSDAHKGYVHPIYGQTVCCDHLICMEDGLSMKMLKRHILTVHGMTPDEYRAKWGLPASYPMVAADYARLRSSLALQSGLGLKPEDRQSKARKRRQM